MKKLLLIILIITTQFATAQTETEIFLFDINKADSGNTLTNKKNISNNPGYDSQPQFLANDIIIYAGTRDGQTEIIQYTRGTTRQFNKATSGGEYSPQFMKGKRGISAVRLDPDGRQRLYSYLPRQDQASVLIKDAVVAYYTWANEDFIVGADIVESNLHLVIHNLKNQTSDDLKIPVGRSFHNIPDTNLISFIDLDYEIRFRCELMKIEKKSFNYASCFNTTQEAILIVVTFKRELTTNIVLVA